MTTMKGYILYLAKTNNIIGKNKDIFNFAKIIIENAFSFKEGKELNSINDSVKECLNKLQEIYYWNNKIANFYKEPSKISEVRTIIFSKTNQLKELIDKI